VSVCMSVLAWLGVLVGSVVVHGHQQGLQPASRTARLTTASSTGHRSGVATSSLCCMLLGGEPSPCCS
jgi:hypothetical protein